MSVQADTPSTSVSYHIRCLESILIYMTLKRGVHNIEREILFQTNNKLVAHDSEGFEAGQNSEVGVVTDFISRRAAMEDVNDKLHMIWYIDTLHQNNAGLRAAFGLILFLGTVWR